MKLNTNWQFTKLKRLNVLPVMQYFQDVLRIFCGFANIFQHISLKMGNYVNKALNSS